MENPPHIAKFDPTSRTLQQVYRNITKPIQFGNVRFVPTTLRSEKNRRRRRTLGLVASRRTRGWACALRCRSWATALQRKR
jgi:hypothetical protein